MSSALEVNRTTPKTLAAKQVSNWKNTDQYESVSVVLLRLHLNRPRDCSVTLWTSLVAMEKYVFCNCGRLFVKPVTKKPKPYSFNSCHRREIVSILQSWALSCLWWLNYAVALSADAECLQRAVEGRAASDEEEEDSRMREEEQRCLMEVKRHIGRMHGCSKGLANILCSYLAFSLMLIWQIDSKNKIQLAFSHLFYCWRIQKTVFTTQKWLVYV